MLILCGLGPLRPIPRSHDMFSQHINTNTEAGLKLLLSNTMSLAPKIDEIRCCILKLKPDVACFTETWLHDHREYKRIEAASRYKFSQARGSN